MSNYDDIFAEKSETTEFNPSPKEDWAEKKKQEREDAYKLIDTTCERMMADPELFQRYLDVQSRFRRYTVSNILLITAQMPDATRLGSFDFWKEKDVKIKKGEHGIVILEPGDEYIRQDGSTGVYFNPKKLFDISQTTAEPTQEKTELGDSRLLMKALIENAPCKSVVDNTLADNLYAQYRPSDKCIHVRQNVDAPALFRSVAQELAYAHMDDGSKRMRSENQFTAYCVSYILCQRNGVSVSGFVFENLSVEFANKEPKDMREALNKIRELANHISMDMEPILHPRQPEAVNRDEGAR